MCEWYGGDECAEVYAEKTRKARKSHNCDGCGCKIKPGEQYNYYSGIYDSEPFSGHVCLPCIEATKAFDERHDGHPSFGGLEEALHECVADDGPMSWAVKYLTEMKERRAAKVGV